MSASPVKVDVAERRETSRAVAALRAQICGPNGTATGLITDISRDGLAFKIDRHTALRIFSGREMPGEPLTVRYDTTDSRSRPRRIEAVGIVVWSEVVADELQVGIRWG